MSLFRCLVILALWAVGCADSSPDPIPPDFDGGAGDDTRSIEVIGSGSVELGFAETADLSFRYLDDASGRAASDPVTFAIEGRAGDSSLSVVTAVPDERGVVTTTLRAGTVGAASFRVRASAPSAANAYVEASVGDAGFGSLSVVAEYHGERDVWGVELRLFTDVPCGEIDPSSPPVAGRGVHVGGLEEDGQWQGVFGSLAVGPSYTVLALGLGKGDGVVVFGCQAEVWVVADPSPTTQIRVPLQDLPYGARGRFELRSSLDLTTALTGRVEAWMEPANTLLASGTEAFLLDRIAAYLSQNLPDEASGAFDDARGDLGPGMAERLAARNGDVAVALASLTSDLVASMRAPTLGSELLLDEVLDAEQQVEALRFSHEALSIEVSLIADSVDVGPALATFSEAGLVSLASGAASRTTDELTVGEHVLPFRLGTIAAAVLEQALVPALGAPSLDAHLASSLDCADLGDWLSQQVQGVCDDACYEAACQHAASDLAEAVLQSLRDGDADYDALALEGHARLSDIDGDASSDALDQGVWTAHLQGGLEADVTAEFVAERNDIE